MNSLTKKQQKLYSELIKEHNSSGLANICSLESFIKSKIDNCRDVWHHGNLVAVLQYAENDY